MFFFFVGSDACVLNAPFTCCVLPDFVRDGSFLTGLKEELLELDFNNKSNDLYKFQQVGTNMVSSNVGFQTRGAEIKTKARFTKGYD